MHVLCSKRRVYRKCLKRRPARFNACTDTCLRKVLNQIKTAGTVIETLWRVRIMQHHEQKFDRVESGIFEGLIPT